MVSYISQWPIEMVCCWRRFFLFFLGAYAVMTRVPFLVRICKQGFLRFSAVGLVSFPSFRVGFFCWDSMSLHFADCFVEFFHASVALCVLAAEVFVRICSCIALLSVECSACHHMVTRLPSWDVSAYDAGPVFPFLLSTFTFFWVTCVLLHFVWSFRRG